MTNNEKVFANGMIFKRNQNAPEWAIGKLSFKIDEAIDFLQKNSKNGWVNININQSQNGKYYLEIDNFDPNALKSSNISNHITNDIKMHTMSKEVQNFQDESNELPF